MHPICIAVILVPLRSTVSTPPICIAVRPPFVLQYASQLYRSTFGKVLVVVVTGMFPKRASFYSNLECPKGVMTNGVTKFLEMLVSSVI